MYELKIRRTHKALGLTRQIVGVRFLVMQKEYDTCNAEEKNQTTICDMVHIAGSGMKVKAKADSFFCMNATYAVGLNKVPEAVSSGREDYQSGRYESLAISRQISVNKQCIPHTIYGIEIAPIECLGTADIAIAIGTAKDIMRIMQGYVKYYGLAKNMIAVANNGICNELIAKPFMNNDINVSLLSACARKNGKYKSAEMGIAMPIHMLENVLDGVLETVNLTENNKPKRELLERLEYPEELGFEIRMNYDYGIQASEYEKYCEECEKDLQTEHEDKNQ